MEHFLGSKRLSVWILLLSLAFAASQMHPGFATMVTLSMLLVLLLLMRFAAHFEGQYMLKAAEAAGHRSVTGPLARELAIGIAIGAFLMFLLVMAARHIPWLWFPGTQ